MKSSPIFALIAATLGAPLAPAAGPAELKYVVIVSRHGVRSPTWDAVRLNQYSALPWPDWGVAPGELTPHGRDLVKIMGAYYREWLTGERLYSRTGCQDAGRIYIWADSGHRTIDTGRALAESLLPGCGLAIHSQPDGRRDPIFAGDGTPDPESEARALRERLGPQPEKLIADHAAALATLQFILMGENGTPGTLMESPIGVSVKAKSVALTGPFATSSALSEDFLLEYANGMIGTDLGWGRLTKENLFSVLELHSVYTDLMRRTPLLARVHGSNLLAHVLCSMEQAVSGKPVSGALGNVGDALLVLSGHDTNLSNISGMLGLSWHLPGYQPDDTPPGGALIFSLWRDPATGEYFVKTRYLAQTLDQMRNGERLTIAAPPASQEVAIPACGTVSQSGCSWQSFRPAVRQVVDLRFTTIGTGLQSMAVR
jgi:4-phytase/acid phosphatase